jgi:O-antigen ligase
MQYFSESPVLGIGPEQFIQRESGRNTHNGFLQVAAELGACGLIVFVGMLLLTLVRCVRNLMIVKRLPQLRLMGELSVYLAVSCVVWAFGSFFQGGIYFHHIYMVLAMTVAVETMLRRQLQEQTMREQQRTMSLPRVAPAPALRGSGIAATQ